MSEEVGTAVYRVERSTWGEWTGNRCRRCDDKLYRHMPNGMCPDCVRETPGTDECHICEEHGERICGYHATCIWYCLDCGHVRRTGNRPVRPGSDATTTCSPSLHPDRGPFELPTMIRLCYESVAPPQLREYYKKRSDAWNEASLAYQPGGDYGAD